MATLLRTLALTWLLGSLIACSSAPDTVAEGSGFGGTGITSMQVAGGEDDSGFGGTGISRGQIAQNEGSQGFGGTGIIQFSVADAEPDSGFGGTGIIGNIDAFGSIWVAGIEVDYPPNVEITSNLKGNDQKLKLGQSVVLATEAELNDDLKPYTNSIMVYYPLAGAIEQSESDRLKVNGQWVQIDETTLKDKDLDLSSGQYVAVNAWQDDEQNWHASRLNHNPQQEQIKGEIDITFGKDVKRIVMDERLGFIRNNWHFGDDFMSQMRQSRMDQQAWRNMRHHMMMMQMKHLLQGQQALPDLHNFSQEQRLLPPPHIRRGLLPPPGSLPPPPLPPPPK